MTLPSRESIYKTFLINQIFYFIKPNHKSNYLSEISIYTTNALKTKRQQHLFRRREQSRVCLNGKHVPKLFCFSSSHPSRQQTQEFANKSFPVEKGTMQHDFSARSGNAFFWRSSVSLLKKPTTKMFVIFQNFFFKYQVLKKSMLIFSNFQRFRINSSKLKFFFKKWHT